MFSVAVIGCVALWAVPAASQQPAPPSRPDNPFEQQLAPAAPSPGPADFGLGIVAKDRSGVLADLYSKLAQATSKEQADRIAAAIEKLWSNSGSDTSDLLVQRASLLQESGNIDGALGLLDAAIALSDSNPEAFNRRAFVYFNKQDYARSLADLRQVLARDPNHFRAIHGLSQILKEFGDKAGALKALRMLKAIHPFADGVEEPLRELERDVEGQKI